MNADRLFAHYAKIADAPGAVACLRRFILDLAVRGRLVSQDPNDEPARELLGRIEERRDALIRTGTLRVGGPHPAIADDAMPFRLPVSWCWVRLADIAEFSAGRTPLRNDSSFWNNGDYAWVSIADMRDGQPLLATKETISDKAKKTVFGSEPESPGTIIMSFKLTIGKIARLGIPAFHNEAIISIRPHLVELDPYMFITLPQFAKQGETKGAVKGATLNRESISNILLPLPPIAEQERIVARVNDLMALCDRLEAARLEQESRRDLLTVSSLARISRRDSEPFEEDARFVLKVLPAITARSDQLKPFREMILNLAVRGKLIPQNRNDEAGPVLVLRLKKALTEMNNLGGIRVRPPVPTLERSEVWFAFPESWALPSFDEIFAIASGVTKGQRVSPEDSVDVPYLRVANVQRGHVDLSVIKNITVKKVDRTRYALRAGDILMTEGGDWDKLGRAAIWREEIPGCIHQNHIFRVRPPSSDILPEWVVIFVNSPLGREFFENASKQTTNLASINMTQLRGCPLPLPPIAEQRRITAKVAELMAVCDQLEQALGRSQSTRQRLLEAVLHEAIEHLDNSSANDLRVANDCVLATG